MLFAGEDVLTVSEKQKFVTKLGFVNTDSESSTGSHFRYRHLDGRRVTIAVHGAKELSKSDMSSILKSLEMNHDDFFAKYSELL